MLIEISFFSLMVVQGSVVKRHPLGKIVHVVIKTGTVLNSSSAFIVFAFYDLQNVLLNKEIVTEQAEKN